MSIPLEQFVKRIDPEKTVLFFGSGSSIPSGSPSFYDLIEKISQVFNLEKNNYSLSEIASLAEQTAPRFELINTLRSLFRHPSVTGGLLNLPLYGWKNIYTTNYDQLIEQAYKRKGVDLCVYSSNFDFQLQGNPNATKLFKLHGSIEKDYSDGHVSRIIISESDYDNTTDYRESLFDTFKNDLIDSSLIIIGYSLSDRDIKEIVNRAIDINSKAYRPSTVYLLLYTEDESRASLYERRGIKVAFGGIDDFFAEISRHHNPLSKVLTISDNPLDRLPTLNSITIDVSHSVKNCQKNVGAMYQGWPANYPDIDANLTFERTIFQKVISSIITDNKSYIIILGASGIGKTTFTRQVILHLLHNDFLCWEHKNDFKLMPDLWREVAKDLYATNRKGVLFRDDAHNNLYELNHLIDLLVADKCESLRVILTSARNQWYPRVKTPNLYKNGEQFVINRLDESEVENLLNLVDNCPDLQPLVENSFIGFSRIERKRRLIAKCESDTFVCLKNIFASEKFDDILLREYAELDEKLRDIYKLVSAMESAGVNVHRQLVIRLLGIPALEVSSSLTNLVDIIHEYTISEREGIYGWKGRHPVITDIVTKYKMKDENEYFHLIETVIDNICPTYDIEIKTIRQLCNFESGISRFPDKNRRNILLRKMISKAPGERIPRHRLIRYLIDLNELEKAETEIRLFENDFKKPDGPVKRFKILLMLARAQHTIGILTEDRIAILEDAKLKALEAISQHPADKNILRTYCDVGIEIFRIKKDIGPLNDAISKLREAEEYLGDPDITNLIVMYERRSAGLEYEDSKSIQIDA